MTHIAPKESTFYNTAQICANKVLRCWHKNAQKFSWAQGFEYNFFNKKIRKSVFNYSSIQKALILIALITNYDYDMFAIVGVQLNKNTVQYLNCFCLPRNINYSLKVCFF